MCGGRQFVFFFFQSFKEMMIFGGQLRRNKTVDFSFGEWNDIDMAAQREYLPQSNASYEHTISFSWIRVYANCYERSLLRAMHLYRPLFYSILFFFFVMLFSVTLAPLLSTNSFIVLSSCSDACTSTARRRWWWWRCWRTTTGGAR